MQHYEEKAFYMQSWNIPLLTTNGLILEKADLSIDDFKQDAQVSKLVKALGQRVTPRKDVLSLCAEKLGVYQQASEDAKSRYEMMQKAKGVYTETQLEFTFSAIEEMRSILASIKLVFERSGIDSTLPIDELKALIEALP